MFTSHDFHIHVPDGATPKDGPSAGVTLTTALVSLLTGKPVRPHLSMTGEITLRGTVTPIGGVKEKVIAALRAGITDVILPSDNAKDLEDVPDEVKEAIRFHFVTRIEEVLDFAMPARVRAAAPKKAKKTDDEIYTFEVPESREADADASGKAAAKPEDAATPEQEPEQEPATGPKRRGRPKKKTGGDPEPEG